MSVSSEFGFVVGASLVLLSSSSAACITPQTACSGQDGSDLSESGGHFFKALREKNGLACICQPSLDGALSFGHTEEAMKRIPVIDDATETSIG